MQSNWPDQVEKARREKDEFFANYHDSPIPHEERKEFRGLNYFPPDKSYVIPTPLHKNVRPEIVTLTTSKGTTQRFFEYGYFQFELGGRSVTLHAYKSAEREDNELFIPFRDKTSGRESYGAARYLDLEENTTGDYTLDFNLAYNPYCAYSEDYICPLPLRENWLLDVEVKAGEKKYHE